MSEPKHTPGPWRVAYHDDFNEAVVMNDHIEICTCWHHSVEAIEKEMNANAHLIASAPELYDALRRLLATIPFNSEGHESDCHCVIHEARAALAKARGETP